MKHKTHIKCMFALKPSRRKGHIDLALLTDNNNYIEYSLDFKSPHLTMYVAQRVRSLFEPYVIDSRTDVMSNELLDEKHPLYQYFMLLRQHIGFKMSTATLDRVVNRLHWYYTKKTSTKSKFNFVWQRVIASGQCPWITQDIEYKTQNKGAVVAKRIKTLRLAVFYIVVKSHLYKQVQRSQLKRQNSTHV